MKTAQAQNIFHGGVGQVKYAKSRVRITTGQPVTDADTPRTPLSDTKPPRTQKRATTRRLSQLATWVEDPIVFTIRQKARKKGLSTSAVIRKLLIKALKDEESVEEALDTESLRQSLARDNRRLASRMSWFLVRLLYEVGHTKVLAVNTLGMQKGMTQDLLKDILQDADRQTTASIARKHPELAPFIEAVEKWLLTEEKDLSTDRQDHQQPGHDPPGPATNGHRGRGGSR